MGPWRELVIAIVVLSAANTAAAQTIWFKYAGNPVLPLGPPGTWDAAAMFPNRVLIEDSIYRMWYSGFDGTSGFQIGIATSRDGVHWSKYDANPVLRPGPANWDANAAFMCDVAQVWDGVGPGGLGYRMWYTGVGTSGRYGIGRAESPDGVIWSKKDSVNPLIPPGTWYDRGPLSPSVLADSNTVERLWFEGNPMAHSDFQIGYGMRFPGMGWDIRPEPVLSFGSAGSWDDDKVMSPKVIRNGKFLELFYCGETSDGRTRIGLATSTNDGVSWLRHPENPVLGRGPTPWDNEDMYALSVLSRDNLYQMWYGGTDKFGQLAGWKIGYAVSPKECGVKFTDQESRTINDRDTVYVGETVTMYITVKNPAHLSFSTEVLRGTFGGPVPDTLLRLNDEGVSPDSFAGDGRFNGHWVPKVDGQFYVSNVLHLNDTLRFVSSDYWTLDVPPPSAVADVPPIPPEFTLEQNYPNPFNPSSEIGYQISGMAEVRLAVYDLLGREVAVLVDERKAPGTYSVRFDGSGLSSGVYVYRLTAGGFTQSRRMLLMR